MQHFNDKIAVITGGASGIGFAMAEAMASEGAKIVIADIEAQALEAAVKKLEAGGADTLGVMCDVSKLEDVAALKERTLEHFGAVHILCNNAGVQVAGNTWQISIGQWKWIMEVNLWGVIHGLHTFVPTMLEQGVEGHIVNTSSMAGLLSVPFMSAYQVTKHGVLTISETLQQELQQEGGKIGVSVLCPAFVQTNLHEAERNRPHALQDESLMGGEAEGFLKEAVTNLVTSGIPADVLGQAVVKAIRAGDLYVLTHPGAMPGFEMRAATIIAANERAKGRT